MKFIRIKGLIAFIVSVAIIWSTWVLFIDGAVKNLIERTGTSIVGARVDLQKADLSLSPLGLTLAGLDVADPDKPMENMIHTDKISFLMDFESLLLGKIIVNEMSIDGVRTGTPRKLSGAIRKKEEKKPIERKTGEKGSSKAFSLPSLDVPDIKEILNKEKLKSLEQIEAIKADLDKKKELWELKIKELPDDKKVDGYNKRIRDIKKGLKGKGAAVLVAVNEASKLQKDIKKDLKNLKRARKALKSDLKIIEDKLKGIEKLPANDLKRLQDKYSLSSSGLSNFSKLLFGGKAAQWADRSLAWYRKLEPILKEMASEEKGQSTPIRAGGTNIKFREYNPQPDFHVKIARVTLDIPAGVLKGEIKNITDNQSLIALPTTLLFTGSKLKGLDSAEIKGEINRLDLKNPFEEGSIVTKGYKLEAIVLSSNKDLPVEIKSARMDGNLTFIHKKERFNGDFMGNFHETHFSGKSREKEKSDLSSLLLSSLQDIKAFNVKGTLSGDQKDYDVKINSNIDRVMKKALSKRAEKESRYFAEKLKKEIAKKIDKPMNDLKKGSSDLGDLDKLLAGNLKDLENQLKSSEKLSSKGIKFKF